MVQVLKAELDLRSREPSDSMVRWLLGFEGMIGGRLTAAVVERCRPVTQNALQPVLRDIVRRSVVALDEGVTAPPASAVEAVAPPSEPVADPVELGTGGSRIVTTPQELEAFAIIKAHFANSALSKATIVDATARKEVPIELAYKDTTGYFGLYLNKPAWWFARLGLDGKTFWLGLNAPRAVIEPLLPKGFVLLASTAFSEVRVGITSVADLHELNQVIFAAMRGTIADRNPKGEPA